MTGIPRRRLGLRLAISFRQWLILCVSSVLHLVAVAELPYISGQLTLEAYSDASSSAFIDQVSLTYQPSLTGTLFDQSFFPITYDAVGQILLNKTPTSTDADAHWYRLNAEAQFDQSDIRIGLQQLNFGSAYVLRSMRWFDQLNPSDPLVRTEGVNALRFRYFFPNNANFWLWVLAENDQPKGMEVSATSEDSVEWGGRLQFPMLSGELALTAHKRTTTTAGFTGVDVGSELQEDRWAVDGRWDPFVGLWFESMVVDQGLPESELDNWVHATTLGMDYTFGLGNGLYTLLEHQHIQTTHSVWRWETGQQTSALQVNYPLTILDSVGAVFTQHWQANMTTSAVNWQRVYDSVSIGISIIYIGGDGAKALNKDGLDSQWVMAWNH